MLVALILPFWLGVEQVPANPISITGRIVVEEGYAIKVDEGYRVVVHEGYGVKVEDTSG